jgi:glycerol-3-phosphate dehydrogenase (NAD(P)+)
MSQEKIAVLGAGSWGSALAYLLGGKGKPVALWDRSSELVRAIVERGHNPYYLPEVSLESPISATDSLKEAVTDAEWVIVAVPSSAVRDVVSTASSYFHPQISVLSVAKGLEAETGLTMSEVITNLLSDVAYNGLAVLSGPNLAAELVRGVPTASVAASIDPPLARRAQELLMTDHTFRVYTQTDVKGVELGGALKNVLAIGAGISDGLGFGDNTKAALMTRGLVEMTQLGVAAGGRAVTFLGLSGVGDLIATASSRLSRNYRVGLGLAQRKPVRDILDELHQAAEGVPTAQAARVLSQRYNVATPVLSTIHNVIYQDLSPVVAVEDLMTRDAKDEFVF